MEGHRSYSDNNLDATELRLGLPGTDSPDKGPKGNKRAFGDEKCQPTSRNGSKAQVVGWPPVRRRGSMQMKNKLEGDENNSGIYVKVSMDGAPYLRKTDLKMYKGYKDLRENLEGMFRGFSLGEHVITYEDKDGDWMMVGDVPWEMFISVCKRLRIMKGTEARGVGSSP